MEDNIDPNDFSELCKEYSNVEIQQKPNMVLTELTKTELEAQVDFLMHKADWNRKKVMDNLRTYGITGENLNKEVNY